MLPPCGGGFVDRSDAISKNYAPCLLAGIDVDALLLDALLLDALLLEAVLLALSLLLLQALANNESAAMNTVISKENRFRNL